MGDIETLCCASGMSRGPQNVRHGHEAAKLKAIVSTFPMGQDSVFEWFQVLLNSLAQSVTVCHKLDGTHGEMMETAHDSKTLGGMPTLEATR